MRVQEKLRNEIFDYMEKILREEDTSNQQSF